MYTVTQLSCIGYLLGVRMSPYNTYIFNRVTNVHYLMLANGKVIGDARIRLDILHRSCRGRSMGWLRSQQVNETAMLSAKLSNTFLVSCRRLEHVL